MEIEHYRLDFHKEIKLRRNPSPEGRNPETQTKQRRKTNQKKHEEEAQIRNTKKQQTMKLQEEAVVAMKLHAKVFSGSLGLKMFR